MRSSEMERRERAYRRDGNARTASTYRTTLLAFEKFAAGRRPDELEGLMTKLRVYIIKARLYLKGTDPFEGISLRIEKTRKLAVSDSVLRKVAASKFPGRHRRIPGLVLVQFLYARNVV